ncbi:MAG: zinc-ribbon domain-containing protein, partial [Polyangia bacterium]|nr:zinc-ribbon domain-containing protein [Polyangia bacterium]
MDVRCEQCGTIYEFEDSRVGLTGITVKCTTCEHIFKVFPKPPAAIPGAAALGRAASPVGQSRASAQAAVAATIPGVMPSSTPPAGACAAPSVPRAAQAADPNAAGPEEDRRWLIRKPSGEIFKFKELTTLQQWIVEQKVSREDEISRTGKVWERLGAIKELEPFFVVVDKARAAEQQAYAKTLLPSDTAGLKPMPSPAARGSSPAPAMPKPRPIPGAPPPAAPPPTAPPPTAPPPVVPPRVAAPKPTQPAPAPSPKPVPAAPTPGKEPSNAQVREAALGSDTRPDGSAVPKEVAGPMVAVSEPYTMGSPVDDAPSPAFETGDLEVKEEPAARKAAWEGRPAPRKDRDDPTDLVLLEDDYSPAKSSSLVKMILVIILGTAAGFGGFAAWSQWDRIKAVFSGARSPTEGAYYKSRTLFRMDTEVSYRQALDYLSRILSGDPKAPSQRERANALATQAEIYAAWAQYLRDDAEDLAKLALSLEEAAKAGSSHRGPNPTSIRKQAAQRESEARDMAAKALQSAQQAHALEVTLKTKRALSEASRVA